MSLLPLTAHPTAPASAGQPVADQRAVLNTVVHRAVLRDIDRAVGLLERRPDARHRRALAAHLHFLLDQLHRRQAVETDHVWPAVVARRPELTVLVDELEAEHAQLLPVCHQLRDAATTWSYDSSDHRRIEVIAALAEFRTVLAAFFEHQETRTMPLVVEALTAGDRDRIEAAEATSAGSLDERARTVFWLLDGIEDQHRTVLLGAVGRSTLLLLKTRYGKRERLRAESIWR